MPKVKRLYSRRHRDRLLRQRMDALCGKSSGRAKDTEEVIQTAVCINPAQIRGSTPLSSINCSKSNTSSSNSSSDTDVILDHSMIESEVGNTSGENVLHTPDSNSDFTSNLARWATTENINQGSLTQLLRVLRSHSCFQKLPSNARTLLRTPRTTSIIDVPPGRYCHFGISEGLESVLRSVKENLYPLEIDLMVNVDGLPLTKSSRSQLWPILGVISNSQLSQNPFIIGAYHGMSKPESPHVYLQCFLDEVNELTANGFTFNDHVFPFKIRAFVCDTPARCYLACTKGHMGFYGCYKCETKGVYEERRVVFPEMNAPLRTNESFVNRSQPQHHTGLSPLLSIQIDMVSDIPLDYMHLVCLGVMKKLIKFWTGDYLPAKLSARQIALVSERLEALKSVTPYEFARRPRSLRESDRWKATEFRELLLYTGPVVFHKILKEAEYDNFLILCVAIRILATPRVCITQNAYAKDLLKSFFINFIDLYKVYNVSYNVHGLLHLADDVMKFGPLDNFGAFVFENYLQKLKKLIRKNDKPLEQLNNRIAEQRRLARSSKVGCNNSSQLYELRTFHNNGPLIDGYMGSQYKEVSFPGFRITSTTQNNYCILTDDSVMYEKNIVRNEQHEVAIIGRKLRDEDNFFNIPCPSSCVGIK